MASKMAGGKKSEKIDTNDIFKLLEKTDPVEHYRFFYLYVATSGAKKEMEDDSDSESSLSESEATDDVSSLGDLRNLSISSDEALLGSTTVDQTEEKKTEEAKKKRDKAMRAVHKKLPNYLYENGGWQKVQDKDKTTSYRALYFNDIKKETGEDEFDHMLRVGECRVLIEKLVDKIKKKKKYNGVNFKVDSLLSKPLLYDEQALKERQKKLQKKNIKQHL